MSEIPERFPAKIGTHYDGCWKHHPECAYWLGRHDEHDFNSAERDRYRAALERIVREDDETIAWERAQDALNGGTDD